MFEISVSARASLNGEEQWRRLQELRPMGGLTAIPAAISVTVVVAVAATVTAAGEAIPRQGHSSVDNGRRRGDDVDDDLDSPPK